MMSDKRLLNHARKCVTGQIWDKAIVDEEMRLIRRAMWEEYREAWARLMECGFVALDDTKYVLVGNSVEEV